jgi:hypothetical protein
VHTSEFDKETLGYVKSDVKYDNQSTNLGVVIMFAASLYLRTGLEVPPTLALVLSFVGLGGGLLGGWLGGELVERLGVGVADNANLNAPNSLTQPNRNEVRVDKSVWHATR